MLSCSVQVQVIFESPVKNTVTNIIYVIIIRDARYTVCDDYFIKEHLQFACIKVVIIFETVYAGCVADFKG